MEIVKGKINNKFYCNTLTEKNKFYLLTYFMLGDADGNENINQFSFSKLDKNVQNYILKMYELVGSCTEDIDNDDFELFGLEFSFPCNEFSYYSFTSFDIVYLDENRNIIPCKIVLDENEKNIVRSFENFKNE